MRGSCALTQDGMSLLGHVFDLHARHGAIMALEAPVRKRAVIVCEAALLRAGGGAGNQVGEFRSMAVPERGVLRLALVTARRAVIIWSDEIGAA